jgi:hypothetical protein
MRTNYTLTGKDHIAISKTNKWLADNGISLDALSDATIWQLQAQRAATRLLKNKAEILTDDEQQLLMNFVRAMTNNKTRNKLTNAHTYLVLNTCKKINRRTFKAQ